MKTINIVSSNTESLDALRRYLIFTLNIDRVLVTDLSDPYKQRKAYLQARESDLLLVEVQSEDNYKGFQFAKGMAKKTLLIFNAVDIEIENVGSFWLVLPFELELLGEKIDELLGKPSPKKKDFEILEERFPMLKEKKNHHH